MSSENDAKNHLIIGLGGTGGKILCELRKRVYEELKTDDVTAPIYLDYLYVDSSPSDLNDKSKWKIMGHSVHLKDTQKVSIHGIGTGVLETLHKPSGISSFLTPEDRALMKDISSVVSAGIGGQRRRLGRLLFANNLNVADEKNFDTRLIETVNAMTNKSGEHSVCFHVCAGLAGGTGSGSFVDVVAQIRKLFAPAIGLGDQYKLILYLYVPEIILTNPHMDSGYYQANGYAALMELNAMSVGAYRPHDVTGQTLDRNGHICRLLQHCEAFETAYLFSNINEAGKQLNINTMLPAAVADFIFQKNIASHMSPNAQMAHLMKCENEDTKPENDSTGAPVHSRRFMSFGVKRVEYPETEIKEFITNNYARQAALQLQYNLWQDGIGFGECSIDEVGLGYKSEIEDKKTLERLLLSNAHLTLSKPIVEHPGTNRWREIVIGWETLVQRYKEDAMADNDKKNWFSNFTRDCELQFNTNYRGHGVKEFYKIQQGEKKGYAAHIRRHIENILFNDWHSGTRSILEVEKYVTLLIEHCDKRIGECDDKVGKYEAVIEHEINPAIKGITDEWNNIGWLKDVVTNASTKVLGKYAEAKRDLYTHKTLIEGYSYAKGLLQAIKIELETLLSQVHAFRIQLSELLKLVAAEADSKCNDAKGDDKIVKKYDPELVRKVMKVLTTDEERQKNNASAIRNEWVKLLGEDAPHSFQALLDKVDLSSLQDLFVNVCLNNATIALADWASGNSGQKLLDVNIVEKIKREYNTDDQLEAFITDLIRSTKCFLQFNAEEMASPNPEYAATKKISLVQLCIPEYNDPTNFREKFINMFAQCCPGFNPSEDVAVSYKSNQIVLVAAAAAFPLRYVANVANLKTVYESKLIGPQAELNKMVMFTETHAKKLPELFAKSKEDMVEELVPTLLLAFGMGLPVRKEDPVTGGKFYAIGFEDEFGDMGDWIKLGKNIFQAVETLTASEADAKKITELVQSKLKSDYRHNEKKTVLRKSIASFVKEQVLPLCGGNDMDDRYQNYKSISRGLFDKELKLED